MTESERQGATRTPDERYARLLEAVRKRITRNQFSTWFQRASLVRWHENDLVLGLPNRFYLEWFSKNFRPLIQEAAVEIGQAPVAVAFTVETADEARGGDAEAAGAEAPNGSTDAAEAAAPAKPAAPEVVPFPGTGPYDRPIQLNDHYTFDNFIVGPSNRVAHASANAVAQEPGRAYNPLFIHGAVGLGKTHLLHAVCREFRRRAPEERMCFLSCEEFTNEFVVALKSNDLERFRARFRDVHLLVIDDIHFLAGKERTQEEFFHTFNRLYQLHRQIVVSSDAAPSEIPTLEDRLVSRFKWGLVAALEQPETETRMAIVRRKAELQGTPIPNDVAELIAANFRNNIRELEGALLSVLARARVAKAPIDMALAREALEPTLQKGRPGITLDRILEAVAGHFQVKPSDLRSKKRSRSVSSPRQVVMYLARRHTALSLEEIGDHFGGRDHSTVLYAVNKVQEQIDASPRFASEIDRLGDRLAAG
jgi:chromosomal replication initiator protein